MKRGLLMTALIFMALFLGSLIGDWSTSSESLSWLGKSYQIGFSTFDLNLHIVVLTLGLQIRVSIAQSLLILVALLSYSKVAKLIFG